MYWHSQVYRITTTTPRTLPNSSERVQLKTSETGRCSRLDACRRSFQLRLIRDNDSRPDQNECSSRKPGSWSLQHTAILCHGKRLKTRPKNNCNTLRHHTLPAGACVAAAAFQRTGEMASIHLRRFAELWLFSGGTSA